MYYFFEFVQSLFLLNHCYSINGPDNSPLFSISFMIGRPARAHSQLCGYIIFVLAAAVAYLAKQGFGGCHFPERCAKRSEISADGLPGTTFGTICAREQSGAPRKKPSIERSAKSTSYFR
jgi:hypothetical protein